MKRNSKPNGRIEWVGNQIVSIPEGYELRMDLNGHGYAAPIQFSKGDDMETMYRDPEEERQLEGLSSIERVVKFYELRIQQPSGREIESLQEYHAMLTARDHDATEWLLDAIRVLSKKASSKRNFAYLAGMLKQWMRHGRGAAPDQELDALLTFFQEETGQEASPATTRVIARLMGEYGAARVTRATGKFMSQAVIDLSLVYATALDTYMGKNVQPPAKAAEDR